MKPVSGTLKKIIDSSILSIIKDKTTFQSRDVAWTYVHERVRTPMRRNINNIVDSLEELIDGAK